MQTKTNQPAADTREFFHAARRQWAQLIADRPAQAPAASAPAVAATRAA